MNLNKAMIIGNLTRDPELRTTPGGAPVATFSVATNYSYTDQAGQRQDKAEFHNIVAWRRLAEIVSQYTKKGSKVFIEGRLQTRDWVGQDGIKRYRTEIVADNMIMLDRPSGASGGYQAGPPVPTEEPVITQNDPVSGPSANEDDEIKVENIPF